MDPIERATMEDCDDDRPVGRVLGRRAALAWLAAGAWMASAPARAATACIARPQQTEGPFFVDERLVRSDIRSDPATGRVAPGAPLMLTLAVGRLGSGVCAPLRDARIEL